MYYFALRENDKLVYFGASSIPPITGEITEAEYNALKAAHAEKLAYAERVFAGEIALDDVPEEYRADVEELVEQMQAEPETPMSDIDEALAILRGEVTE